MKQQSRGKSAHLLTLDAERVGPHQLKVVDKRGRLPLARSDGVMLDGVHQLPERIGRARVVLQTASRVTSASGRARQFPCGPSPERATSAAGEGKRWISGESS